MKARRFPLAILLAVLSAVALSACGDDIALEEDDPLYAGAVLFEERCSGCHTISVAGTEGSPSDPGDREPTDGPDFDDRPETVEQVLYAIRNGGFSGAIMPENIVVGEEALAVARFVAEYAGGGETGATSEQRGRDELP